MKILLSVVAGLFLVLTGGAAYADSGRVASAAEASAEKRLLGRKLFFDMTLSEPAGQACASCHLPAAGFADPDAELPVSRGVNPRHFGNRNTPTAAYAAFAPAFHFDQKEGLYLGGFFHDGRAATLEAQAKGPLLNPLEMGNASAAAVIEKVERADYAPLFKSVYGPDAFADVARAYDHLADAIASFERSEFFSPFSAKYDAYLRGQVELTPQEKRGLDLFENEKKGNCAACHPSEKGEDGSHPLFTDFSYDNLGVPKLKQSPFYHVDKRFNREGAGVVDLGLGGVLNKASENGKFKVPTLRNVAVTGPYMHNGFFNTLEEVLDFYNTRDTDRKWPAPEVAANVNDEEMGDLNLSREELQDLIAFLNTLTDGYRLGD